MKKKFALAAILASSILVALPAPSARADVSVSLSFFQGSLAPYGRWVTAGSYGRCWYPVGVPSGWQPYTVGHWGYGDYGYTWLSADPWGDVTYRYGTWTFVPPYGWVWVPGYTWAPAWVTWSYSSDYIGWAPIPPSFSFAVGGYYGSPVVVSRSWYCFVPKRQFVNSNVAAVRVPVRQNSVLLASARNVTRFPVSNGVVRNTGVPLRNVEGVTQARVPRVNASQMRVAPARVEATRTSAGSRRIAVAAPATTGAESRSTARVENNRSARPSSNARPSSSGVREAPASRSVRPAPAQRSSETSRPSSASRTKATHPQQSRVEPRASAPAPSAARERERARTTEASRQRPQPKASAQSASRPQPSRQSQVKADAKRSAPSSRAQAPSSRKPASPRPPERERPNAEQK